MRNIFLVVMCISFLYSQKNTMNVVPLSSEQLHTIITQREGKVLFRSVWATWCKPCAEEFPDIIKLAEDYQKSETPVEFIALSADYTDEIDTKILPFLKKFKRIPFKVFVADVQSMDEFISSLNKEWGGAIPATFIFSSDGMQQTVLIGKHSREQFKTEIEKVLHSY